jgi:Apg6 BARA domain
MHDEENDQVTPLCTCGTLQRHLPHHDDHDSSPPGAKNSPHQRPTWLESSFVHLMAPRSSKRPLHHPYEGSGKGTTKTTTTTDNHHHHSPHGYLEQHQHLEHLLLAAATAGSLGADIPLCSECIDRVAAALDADTQRLQDEIKAYQDTVVDTKTTLKTFESVSKVPLRQAEQAYHEEILMLQQEVEAREAELAHLYRLYKEQLTITDELGEWGDRVHQDQCALELQAKAFDDSAILLSKSLSNIQSEVDQLSMVRLPLSLFDLQVDERGLRYPLINQLRLAFWPKGDATESEIKAAWSQATQLLLVLGTLLQYTSSEWKLVPLSDCAKLIYRKEIFNLKPGDCRSLMAWNALLDQVIRHAKTVFSQSLSSQSPPFPSSPSSIGNTELARLDRTDHVSWSHVVHRMASNLLWLSERVSEYVALQVSTLAHSTV